MFHKKHQSNQGTGLEIEWLRRERSKAEPQAVQENQCAGLTGQRSCFANWMLDVGLSTEEAVDLLGYDRSTIYAYWNGRTYDRGRGVSALKPDIVTRMAMAAISAGRRDPLPAFDDPEAPMRVRLALTAAALGLAPVPDAPSAEVSTEARGVSAPPVRLRG